MLYRFTLLLFLSLPGAIHGQSLIGFSGSNSQNINSSAGEVVIGLASDASYSLTVGFQQPLLQITAIEEDVLVDVSIYPNPVLSHLNVEHSMEEALTLILRDDMGRALELINDLNQTYILNLEEFPNGRYIIEFVTEKARTSYSILKLN
jgi:hypothetical protein